MSSMLPEVFGVVCLILVYLKCAEAFLFNLNLIRSRDRGGPPSVFIERRFWSELRLLVAPSVFNLNLVELR